MDEVQRDAATPADVQRRALSLIEHADSLSPDEMIRQLREMLIDGQKTPLPRYAVSEASSQCEGIVESLNLPLLALDSSMSVQYANRAFYEAFQTLPEAVVGRLFFELGDSQWEDQGIRDLIRRGLEGDCELPGVEIEQVYPDVGRRVMYLRVLPMVRETAASPQLLVTIEDITSRKDADLARRNLTAIIDATEEAVFRKDLDGVVTAWNKGAEHMYGFRAEEVLGRHIGFIIPDRQRDEFEDLMNQLRLGRAVKQYETIRRRKDGKLINVSLTISPILDDNGKAIAAAVLGRDITAQKKLQRDLAELAVIVQTSADAIIGLSLEGIVTSWNRGAESMYGYGPKEAVGRHTSLIIPEDYQAEFDELLVQLRKGSRIDQFETVRRRKDGRLIDVSITYTPITGQDGEVRAISIMARDITHRRRHQQQLEQINRQLERINSDLRRRTEELERANKDLEAFSFSVSHDLRAPLRTIDGFSHALFEDYSNQLDSTGRDYLQRVHDAADHMRRLIEALLRLSRVSQIDLHLMRTDLSELAQVVVGRLSLQSPDRKVECIIEDNIVAVCDRQLVEVVLDNLLSNAWKFTTEREVARVEFGVMRRDDQPVYFVRDNGAGFDPVYAAERLFRYFQRLHHEDRFPGLGIGLPLVRRVVERHGGSVWADGAVNEGATFYFTIGSNLEVPDRA